MYMHSCMYRNWYSVDIFHGSGHSCTHLNRFVWFRWAPGVWLFKCTLYTHKDIDINDLSPGDRLLAHLEKRSKQHRVSLNSWFELRSSKALCSCFRKQHSHMFCVLSKCVHGRWLAKLICQSDGGEKSVALILMGSRAVAVQLHHGHLWRYQFNSDGFQGSDRSSARHVQRPSTRRGPYRCTWRSTRGNVHTCVSSVRLPSLRRETCEHTSMYVGLF